MLPDDILVVVCALGVGLWRLQGLFLSYSDLTMVVLWPARRHLPCTPHVIPIQHHMIFVRAAGMLMGVVRWARRQVLSRLGYPP